MVKLRMPVSASVASAVSAAPARTVVPGLARVTAGGVQSAAAPNVLAVFAVAAVKAADEKNAVEFLPVLPHQSPETARTFMERAMAGVQVLDIIDTGSPTGVLTLSAGIAGTSNGRPVFAERLILAADEALYRAKTTGRNRATPAS